MCFVNQALHPEVADHHLAFHVREDRHGLTFCDDLEIHLIELPKFTKAADQLSDALDRWCYFLRHGQELDSEQLPATLDVPVIRRAMEVLTVFTQDERERAAYEARLRAQRDYASSLREAEERGEGRGEKRGREQGELVGQIRLCQQVLKQPLTPEEELYARPEQELAALLEQLRQQLHANGSQQGQP